MLNKVIRLSAGALACTILISALPSQVFGTSAEGTMAYVKTPTYSNFRAGVHSAINETVVLEDTKDEMLYAAITTNKAPVVATAILDNEYENIGISTAEKYVHIRAKADANSESLGKLYANGAATVLERLDGWYKVNSGSVTGYVSADYLLVGDEEKCKSVSKKTGTVSAISLRLRADASLEADTLTILAQGSKVSVLDNKTLKDWVKVKYGTYTGYVASEYLNVSTVYTYAESKAEEEARLRREAEAAAAAAAAEAAKKQQANKNNANKTYKAPEGYSGYAVVNYACQFVGNPYRWGGTSLTKGADCSGFVMSVYKAFGIDLPRSSYEQRFVGKKVSEAEALPGDLICYNGHVAIYLGDGKIVHASNQKEGIKISNNWKYKKIVAIRRVL